MAQTCFHDHLTLSGQLLADDRRDKRPAPWQEEGLSEAFFQVRQRARDGRLAQADQFRAFRDAARFDDGGKLGKVSFVNFHNNALYCASKFQCYHMITLHILSSIQESL